MDNAAYQQTITEFFHAVWTHHHWANGRRCYILRRGTMVLGRPMGEAPGVALAYPVGRKWSVALKADGTFVETGETFRTLKAAMAYTATLA